MTRRAALSATKVCPAPLSPTLIQLRDELGRLQQAFSASRMGIAFESPFTDPEWLRVCANHLADRKQDRSSETCGECLKQDHGHIVDFEPSGIGRCQIRLCSPEPIPSAIGGCVEELVKAVVENHEFAKREKLLFEELAASWETLEALYETGVDLRSHDSLQKVIDRLLDRSVSTAPDISAVFWILDKDVFRPVAQRRCGVLAPRSQLLGILGQTHQGGVSIVIDSCTSQLVNTEFSPELRGSGPVVVIPVHTRQGLAAVFEVWRKSGERPFETPAIRLLEAIAQQITIAIENDRLYRAALEGERVAQEIEIGASIQQQLLFGHAAEKLLGGEIGHCMIPSRLASGDFYALVRHSEVCVDVVLGDVMGKGIPAALTGAATKIALLRVLAESKAGEANCLPEPAEIVTTANRQMSAQLKKLDSFVTLFYARFDFEKNTLTFVDAGHTETAHFIRERDSIVLLHGEGFPLGFSESEIYRQSTVLLAPGDIILAYSDGMTDAINPQKTPYETRGIVRYLKRHASLSASEITRGLAEDLKAYRSAVEPPEDDLTFLVIKLDSAIKAPAVSPAWRYVMMARPDQLEGLRNWLVGTLRAGATEPIAEETVFNLQLALQEAAANIIFHGIKPGASQEISVVANFEGSELHLELAYEGPEFFRERAPAPSFDGSRDHGFGLFLIDQLVDEVSYSFKEGHNSIRLSKKLKGL